MFEKYTRDVEYITRDIEYRRSNSPSHVHGKGNLQSPNYRNSIGGGCRIVGGDRDDRLRGEDLHFSKLWTQKNKTDIKHADSSRTSNTEKNLRKHSNRRLKVYCTC